MTFRSLCDSESVVEGALWSTHPKPAGSYSHDYGLVIDLSVRKSILAHWKRLPIVGLKSTIGDVAIQLIRYALARDSVHTGVRETGSCQIKIYLSFVHTTPTYFTSILVLLFFFLFSCIELSSYRIQPQPAFLHLGNLKSWCDEKNIAFVYEINGLFQ